MFSLWATRHLEDGKVYITLETVDTASGDVIQVLSEAQWSEVKAILGQYPDIALRTPSFVYTVLAGVGCYLLAHFPTSYSHMVHFDPRLLQAPLKTNIHIDLPPYGDGLGPLSMRVPIGDPLPVMQLVTKEF